MFRSRDVAGRDVPGRARASGPSGRTIRLIAQILLIATGCAAPTSHTPAIYQDDPVAGAALTSRASNECIASNANEGIQPVRPFVTDGCSRFPDTDWNLSCCVEHDIAYWCGGDAEARLAADTEFGECVAGLSNRFTGWLMKTGVRMGGHPVWPSSYRWGYGHFYRSTYPSAVAPE